MDPFAQFLVAMGYPAERIRNPADGAWSYKSSESSARLAGMIAWHYERDGMMPLLIGYSGGGMLAVRTLHELAGAFASRVAVVNAQTGEALPRDTITDPRSGREQPVVGLKVPYACALATGLLPRFILGQWTMLGKLHDIPDTVDEFTGFVIEWDPIAGTFPRRNTYGATGTARVRNVTLPATYSHVDLPRTEHLAENPVTRAWIDGYRPDAATPLPDATVDTTNLLHAADIWHSVATHWCREAKRLASGKPMKGRLNIFQGAMLRWRELHPYNAVHVVRIDARLDATRLSRDIDAVLTTRGLTGLVLDAARRALRVRAEARRRRSSRCLPAATIRTRLSRGAIERGINTDLSRTRPDRSVPVFRGRCRTPLPYRRCLRPRRGRRRLDRRVAGGYRPSLHRRRRRSRTATGPFALSRDLSPHALAPLRATCSPA